MNINDYKVYLKNANENIETIRDRVKHSITDADLIKYFGNNVNENIIKYSELANYKNIEEILPSHNSYKIILIENELNSGHWVLIMRYNKTIEFFNSYGLKPSKDLHFVDNLMNFFLEQDKKYLNFILNDAKNRFNIIYNKKRFQKISKNVNTCGRHIILRLLMLLFFGLNLYDCGRQTTQAPWSPPQTPRRQLNPPFPSPSDFESAQLRGAATSGPNLPLVRRVL